MTVVPTTTPSPSSCQPVAGVWSRVFEEDPLGDAANADTTTLVLWTQTPKSGIYVDLRLPMGNPGRTTDVTDTADRTVDHCPSALRATNSGGDDVLLSTTQKSFAGVLTYTPKDTTSGEALKEDPELKQLAENPEAALPLCTCFWRRDIDYQPPSGGLDVGVCASYQTKVEADGTVDLRETGDDGSYAEKWHRLPNTHQGPFMALELVAENGHPRKGFWVRAGPRFAYAVGRPETEELAEQLGCAAKSVSIQGQVGKNLQQAVEGMEEDEKKSVLASFVCVAGEIEAKTGVWRIKDSTTPGLVDCTLVGPDALHDDNHCCSALMKIPVGGEDEVKEGDTVKQIVCGDGGFSREWKVVEWSSGCSLPFL